MMRKALTLSTLLYLIIFLLCTRTSALSESVYLDTITRELSLQEVDNARKLYQKSQNWQAYSEHLNRTSILFPIPPSIYILIPIFLKRTLFLDLPIYVFYPGKDDDEERRKNRERNSENATNRGSESGPVENTQIEI